MFLAFQPVVAFAGEHCHPSFYSTVHGGNTVKVLPLKTCLEITFLNLAYLSGRTAAQFMLNAAAKSKEADDDEDVYNLGAASVADLSTWLQVSTHELHAVWFIRDTVKWRLVPSLK